MRGSIGACLWEKLSRERKLPARLFAFCSWHWIETFDDASNISHPHKRPANAFLLGECFTTTEVRGLIFEPDYAMIFPEG